MTCTTCHGSANFDPAKVPGDPHWQLAPLSMGWQGKSLGAVCNQLKDPKQTGGRDLAAILKHVVTDSLVKWAWAPGGGPLPLRGIGIREHFVGCQERRTAGRSCDAAAPDLELDRQRARLRP
jgi:hypothetical protein